MDWIEYRSVKTILTNFEKTKMMRYRKTETFLTSNNKYACMHKTMHYRVLHHIIWGLGDIATCCQKNIVDIYSHISNFISIVSCRIFIEKEISYVPR